jgi:hypothetical protein
MVSLGQAKHSVQNCRTVKRVPEQFSWGIPKRTSGVSGVPSLARGTNAAGWEGLHDVEDWGMGVCLIWKGKG